MGDFSPQSVTESLFVTRIVIEKLFGRYTYDLKPKASPRSLSRLLMLYGENGTGKTTILWLIYHLLATEPAKGHRTFLAKSRFKRLRVDLSNGMSLSAYRRGTKLVGSFEMSLLHGSHTDTFLFKVDADGAVGNLSSNTEFLSFTKLLPVFDLHFLADDRKMSTEIDFQSRELESTQRELRHLTLIQHLRGEAIEKLSRTEPILTKVVQWIREQALAGSNEGQLNVNAIYADIIARLGRRQRSLFDANELVKTLKQQAARNKEFTKYGLTSDLSVDSLVQSIRGTEKRTKVSVMAQILQPFIEGNEARLKAMEPIQKRVETFVDSINRLYNDKKITFNLRSGIQFVSKNGEALSPQVLSSGEKQLLILFCNVLMTGASPTVFIVDEPELSLNVKWQRVLIDSLISCTGNNPVQFIFATHSLEILAKHRQNVARLMPHESDLAPSELPLFGDT